MVDAIPAVFDMDIGSDPDDTYVALMVLHDVPRFAPALLLTNDETKSRGRARYLATLASLAGIKVHIAAGLPSLRHRATCLVEDVHLTRNDVEFDHDGVMALLQTLETHVRIRYFSLGALTNLDAVLSLRPDLAARIDLVQMGPALRGAYRRDAPQYNARLDPGAFLHVVKRVPHPTFVFSHSTWGTYSNSARQKLGVYPDNPFAQALRNHSAASALYVRHLEAWTKTGKDCSILHDPTTVLGVLEPGFVDFKDVTMAFDIDGWANLSAESHEELRNLPSTRTSGIANYLIGNSQLVEHPMIPCTMSLDRQVALRKTIEKT